MEWSTYTSPMYFKLGDSWVRGDTILAVKPNVFHPDSSTALYLSNGDTLSVDASMDTVMRTITKKKD